MPPARKPGPLAAEALGFVGGALLGYGLARLLGHDLLQTGAGPISVIALAAVGLGGGAGLAIARRWVAARTGARTGE